MRDHLRHHAEHDHLQGAFGTDRFGRLAERFARFFGTPRFLIGQTIFLAAWIALNGNLLHLGIVWDVYPFILANLGLSMQAAYAAPLILLASTRQADRDKAVADADAKHREELATEHETAIAANTALTEKVLALSEQVHTLAEEIHAHVTTTT